MDAGTAMKYEDVVKRWNAGADNYNDWDSLSEEEAMIEYAVECTRSYQTLIEAAIEIRDRLHDMLRRDDGDPLALFGTAEDQMALSRLDQELPSIEEK